MTDTLQQWDRVRGAERRVVMATLVATRGTTPKREGAKMWVGESGRVLGAVTIGGCVDARVVQEAAEVLRAERGRLVSLDLGDKDAGELGFTCAGTVDVLLEPVEPASLTDPCATAYARVRAHVEAGSHGVIVTSLTGQGGKLVVLAGDATIGTLGSAELDDEATQRADELIQRGVSRTLELGRPAESRAAFFEVHGPPPTLVVFGAGHVAQAVVWLGHELGMRTVVVDARPRFANAATFPAADEIRVGIPSEIAAELRYGPSTFAVLVAHDYKYDIPILTHVLGTDAAYVGMLGSRRRGQAILELLASASVSDEARARLHVPIGLDIGAETAAEIAVSILAEALAVRAGRAGGLLSRRPP